jgi:signal peptidase I
MKLVIAALILLSIAGFIVLQDTNELDSPSDWIKEDQILVSHNEVILKIPGVEWATFTNTNSMDPFLDEDSHALEILPNNAEEIAVGDIIAYNSKDGVIIHRVVEKSYDQEGIFFTVKGDNNNNRDPDKVRFSDIQGVLVAVIY